MSFKIMFESDGIVNTKLISIKNNNTNNILHLFMLYNSCRISLSSSGSHSSRFTRKKANADRFSRYSLQILITVTQWANWPGGYLKCGGRSSSCTLAFWPRRWNRSTWYLPSFTLTSSSPTGWLDRPTLYTTYSDPSTCVTSSDTSSSATAERPRCKVG